MKNTKIKFTYQEPGATITYSSSHTIQWVGHGAFGPLKVVRKLTSQTKEKLK